MRSPDSTPSGDRRPRVLIAEDDSVTRLLLSHWLNAWGYEVLVAADGIEAWNILEQENPPKLILLDWMMPGIDGIELCRRLRTRSADYYQYILMISARADMRNVVFALESGADDCIAKPFEELDLRARLSVANRILSLQDELIRAREELRLRAMKDSLTDLWNRAAFDELFEQELQRALRTNTSTGLLLLDLDRFKRVNDTHGHIAGDIVLRKVAALLRQTVRTYDFVGRFGGEEFLICVPSSDENRICTQAERIRDLVAHTPVHVGSIQIPISVSIGVTVVPPTGCDIAGAFALADVALYRAKDTGRNRTVCCGRNAQDVLTASQTPQSHCAACPPGLASSCGVEPSRAQLKN